MPVVLSIYHARHILQTIGVLLVLMFQFYGLSFMICDPGMEAVGVVTAVGPGLTGRKVGDVVAYAGKPMGSYAQEQILPANVAVPVPSSIDHKTAAAIMLKGMTVHVLVRRVFKVQSGLLCHLRFMDLSLDE
jgi:threonine dehydrogenase-like Zn-dependent dehydrogenase